MPAGRPSIRTPELEESLFEHIASGGSVWDWCQQEGKPGYSTVMRWREDDPAFREKYTRAQEAQGDYYAERVVSTAENCIADANEIQLAKVKIDAYKWAAGKRKPKEYGDKSSVDLTSGGKPIESLTDEERTARLATILEQARARRAGQAPTE